MSEIDVHALREQLNEAEELRRAISRGEVDAFVVGSNEEAKQVLLLANAYQRYRNIVERLQQGIVTVSAEGAVLFANHRFVELVGGSLTSVYAARFESHFAPAHRERLAKLLTSRASSWTIDLELVRRDRTVVPVQLGLASFNDGFATILVSELSQHNLVRRTAESFGLLREAVEALSRSASLDADARKALDAIRVETNTLAGLVEEMQRQVSPPARA